MDKPTGSLDIEMKSYIIKNIKKIWSVKLVIVSHRKTALTECSSIFKINDKGNLIKV